MMRQVQQFLPGNIDVKQPKYDFSKYNLSDIKRNAGRRSNYVDILPTYLHAERP